MLAAAADPDRLREWRTRVTPRGTRPGDSERSATASPDSTPGAATTSRPTVEARNDEGLDPATWTGIAVGFTVPYAHGAGGFILFSGRGFLGSPTPREGGGSSGYRVPREIGGSFCSLMMGALGAGPTQEDA